ncbi:MAG TPA: ABC transporter permease [Bryobacteraceae bacterium]|nr:ABC transporter permease [Bryobacteraceae bacterium]
MRTIWSDLRYAARALRHSPGLVLAAAVSLGLGMSVNTALFSAVRALLFEEATVAAPDRLVRIWLGGASTASYPNLQDLERSGVLAGTAGSQFTFFSARTGGDAERIMGEVVTSNYFDVLGVHPAMGGAFSPGGTGGGQPHTAVLSNGFWRRHFGPDPAALGRSLSIDGQTYTIAGILPRGFRPIEGFGLAPEIYVPLDAAVAEGIGKRDGRALSLIGRLKEGRTRQQTQSALAGVARQLESSYPRENRGFARAGARVFGISAAERLREAQVGAAVVAVTVLLSVLSGIVLLIACSNVAGLLLARGANRGREIAVRLALGASRRQLVQQLLAESLLLAIVGGGCGWLLSLWTTGLLSGLQSPLPLPIPVEFRVDLGLGLLPFELLLVAATMLLCGLAPALASTRVELVPALKGEPRRLGTRRAPRRNLRVVVQVANSMVLLAAAWLSLRALQQTVHLAPGFDAGRLLTAEINLDSGRFNRARGLRYVDQAVREIAALPGVESASAAAVLVPARFMWLGTAIHVEGRAAARDPRVGMNVVTPGYFRTMGIALLRGRDFAPSDGVDAPRVAIVNEAFAKRFFPAGEAAGKRVRTDGNETLEVVGVVRDSAYLAIGEAPQAVLYQPMAQEYGMGLVLHVRTVGNPTAMAPAVKWRLGAIEKDVPVRMASMSDHIELSLVSNRAVAATMGIVGAIGMLLAAIGLYGVVSYNVSRRTPEIGIRMALGAAPEFVLWGVLKDGLALVGWGVGLGLAVTLALMQPVSAFLGIGGTYDPLGLVAPSALLLAAGLAASYIPARRATRVDPLAALRSE